MPDPFLRRPYIPTPGPRIFLLYVPHLGTNREAGILSVQSGQIWGETLGIKYILLPFMTILKTEPDPKAR
jgi:hypothetical protein